LIAGTSFVSIHRIMSDCMEEPRCWPPSVISKMPLTQFFSVLCDPKPSGTHTSVAEQKAIFQRVRNAKRAKAGLPPLE
jgi:hypothetical protein